MAPSTTCKLPSLAEGSASNTSNANHHCVSNRNLCPRLGIKSDLWWIPCIHAAVCECPCIAQSILETITISHQSACYLYLSSMKDLGLNIIPPLKCTIEQILPSCTNRQPCLLAIIVVPVLLADDVWLACPQQPTNCVTTYTQNHSFRNKAQIGSVEPLP